MQRCRATVLRDLVSADTTAERRFVSDRASRLAIASLAGRTGLGGRLAELRGRRVLLMTQRQIGTVLAAIELDGVAQRIVLCTPGLPDPHLAAIMRDAAIDAVVVDAGWSGGAQACGAQACGGLSGVPTLVIDPDRLQPGAEALERTLETEWVLLTSGTTGPPKLAVHSLASLVAPIGGAVTAGNPVWSTFYDVRRYGGLQILLRALVGGGSMVLTDHGEPLDGILDRAGALQVSHISGTPSHWRSVLMCAASDRIAPSYVRLSGEACDQAILDRLKLAYPRAMVTHAFASTEAGVAFDVRDGRAGFPESLIGSDQAGVQLRVREGSLRIRSSRTASRYLRERAEGTLADEDGYVDTGDLLELRHGRYHFIGRRGGVINVGGLKVHPEAVEAIINEHPDVHTSRVSGRASPIIGALVVAEVVIKPATRMAADFARVRRELLDLCQARLPSHQVPATFREVETLQVASSGKMTRLHA